MTTLLDSNMLIALLVGNHVHHDAAETWMTAMDGRFATCPVTQASLVRLLIRDGRSAVDARAVLTAAVVHDRHEFWADDIGYEDVPIGGIIGHRQVTDAYLAQLTRVRNGRLATFDRALAALHPDVAELVPAG